MPQYLTVAIYHGLSFSSRWTFQFGTSDLCHRDRRTPIRPHKRTAATVDLVENWIPVAPFFPSPSTRQSLDGQNNSVRMKIHVLRRSFPRNRARFALGSSKAREILMRWSNHRISGYLLVQKKRYPPPFAITVHQIFLIPRRYVSIVNGTND